VTASEFAFLVLGLVLGVATGAAIIELLRARPPAPREVRITIAPASLSSRASTLASSAPLAVFGPARGGPGDRRLADREEAAGMASGVRRPVAVAIESDPDPEPIVAALRSRARAQAMPLPVTAGAVAGDGSHRPAAVGAWQAAPREPRGTRPGDARTARPRGAGDARRGTPEPESVALVAAGNPGAGGTPGSGGAAPGPATDPCAEARRAAEERCAIADRLVAQAEAVTANLRDAQRAYDEHLTRASHAAEVADSRALRAAKEAAHLQFRTARAAAGSREAVEAAARAWLQEINRINNQAREATLVQRREQEAANGLVTVIERLTVEADAARIAAESAQQVCLAAREAVAACEEAAAGSTVRASAPLTSPEVTRRRPPDRPEPAARPGAAATELHPARTGPPPVETAAATRTPGPGEPAIFRLLRGDRATLRRVVAQLAGDDPDERRRWQLRLTDLVDAILARAIEASTLDFPVGHPFWGPFSREQAREIASALGSLGYRFDGLGGFADGRIPSQRDLSLAVGYTGLDPMRTRRWPTEAEMTELFREVTVAGDEYLAATAGSLTLGEMVSMLGRRADGLTELWNAWGRIRPLLLATD